MFVIRSSLQTVIAMRVLVTEGHPSSKSRQQNSREFQQRPESIAVYSLDGKALRSNSSIEAVHRKRERRPFDEPTQAVALRRRESRVLTNATMSLSMHSDSLA